MKTVIIDCGMGNLGSVRRAFEECGADCVVSDDPVDLRSAARIVLPGVGAFADGMSGLVNQGWVPAITRAAMKDRTPLLGICLGMHLLADMGYEGGEVQGLGLIRGEVTRLVPVDASERIPHVGWNEVYHEGGALFDGIESGTDFYFVHSYQFVVRDPADVMSTTPYCGGFVSSVASGNIFGVQFHPEKSSRPGFQLIKNFLRI